MPRPAVFLDRDGTIIREVGYLRSPTQMRLLPRAAEAIKRLSQAGYAVIVVTNQSAIARGMLREHDLEAIHVALRRRLARRGAHLDATYYCPHHPEAVLPEYRRSCRCRKPAPGMLLRAARQLGLDLKRSFAVGDGERDLAAGIRAGCGAVLVRTGYGMRTEVKLGKGLRADYVADDLWQAATWIVQHPRRCRARA